MDEWEEDDEMGVATAFVLAFTIGAFFATVTAAAIIWNAVDATASLVRSVRRN